MGIGDFQPNAKTMEHSMFSQLLVADSVRGTHGTGILKIYTNGGHDWRKIAGDPYELFRSKGVNDFYNNFDKKDVRFIVGHNRAATTGEKDSDSAHPFEIGDIVLMHNGTLEKYNTLVDFDKFPVDSEAICNSIDKVGIRKTLGDIRGAYSLIYYNSKEKTLNLIRNKERPMYVGIHLAAGRVYFSSEHSMLKWILLRNNISSAVVEELPPHMLLSFSLDNIVPKMTDLEDAVSIYAGGFYRTPARKWNSITLAWEDDDDKTTLTEDLFKTKRQKKRDEKKAKTTALTVVDPTPRSENPPGTISIPSSLDVRNLTTVGSLYGHSRGELIEFEILNYDLVNDATGTYRIEGMIRESPDVAVWSYLKGGDEALDPLLLERAVSGRIRSLQFNTKNINNKREHHRIWVDDLLPIKEMQAEIIKFPKNEIEEAEIVEDLRSELQILNNFSNQGLLN